MGKCVNLRKPSLTDDLFRYFEVVCRLQIDPILWCLSECLTKEQGHFSSDRSPTIYDMGNSHCRKADCPGKDRLGYPQFVKYLLEKFPRMDRRQSVFRVQGSTSLVIINNFNIVRLSVFKSKTNTPLIVYADTPLTGAFSAQHFQVIGWRHADI